MLLIVVTNFHGILLHIPRRRRRMCQLNYNQNQMLYYTPTHTHMVSSAGVGDLKNGCRAHSRADAHANNTILISWHFPARQFME
jgi:hypothetical protein